jgi:hypothetical protein
LLKDLLLLLCHDFEAGEKVPAYANQLLEMMQRWSTRLKRWLLGEFLTLKHLKLAFAVIVY